jgi:hypothetical protein
VGLALYPVPLLLFGRLLRPLRIPLFSENEGVEQVLPKDRVPRVAGLCRARLLLLFLLLCPVGLQGFLLGGGKGALGHVLSTRVSQSARRDLGAGTTYAGLPWL